LHGILIGLRRGKKWYSASLIRDVLPNSMESLLATHIGEEISMEKSLLATHIG